MTDLIKQESGETLRVTAAESAMESTLIKSNQHIDSPSKLK
jgi:hypothetical protein